MLNDLNIASTSAHNNGAQQEINENEDFRDIHALAPPPSLPPTNVATNRARRREAWETSSLQSSSSGENFTTMSREFSALVLAGSTIADAGSTENDNNNVTAANDNSSLLARIGEDEYDAPPEGEEEIETNPLAIVADNSGVGASVGPPRSDHNSSSFSSLGVVGDETVTVQRVKKAEVETKISAWQNAKVAKINNRFKREDAVISGWESEQVHIATSWMKKVERKLEEKRARALEKMQNDVAKARRKAEERRASAEATRGTKVARILEIANLMRAVGRAPVKRSFF